MALRSNDEFYDVVRLRGQNSGSQRALGRLFSCDPRLYVKDLGTVGLGAQDPMTYGLTSAGLALTIPSAMCLCRSVMPRRRRYRPETSVPVRISENWK
jgi:hypothetical protein